MSAEGRRLWHGGVPGLRKGDLILPGQARKHHYGCPFCEARSAQAAGGPKPSHDALSERPDRVYATTQRLYARHYASLFGRGDLYRVRAQDDAAVERSWEDTVPTWTAPAWLVVAVVDRAVLLTWGERRRLTREWETYDLAAEALRQLKQDAGLGAGFGALSAGQEKSSS
jgi:hypothetical protein